MTGSSTQHLLRRPEPLGPTPDAHGSQQGDIDFGVDPAVEISAGCWDTPLRFERSQIGSRYTEPASCCRNVEIMLHAVECDRRVVGVLEQFRSPQSVWTKADPKTVVACVRFWFRPLGRPSKAEPSPNWRNHLRRKSHGRTYGCSADGVFPCGPVCRQRPSAGTRPTRE